MTILGEVSENWLHIRADDGSSGYITRRYLAKELERAQAPSADSPRAGGLEATCAAARAAASRPGAPGAQPRIATFNVRWFPDGQPGKKAPAGGGTDLGFLACSIAATGAEVVAVQEFKRGARAEASLRTVLDALDQSTRGAWQARFDDCPIETAQHVGVLFDARRATALGEARTVAELNPLGSACAGSLRPALAQRFRLSSGATIELYSVHLKSGDDARSRALRQKSLSALASLPAAEAAAGKAARIVAGDFNTMGCDDCSPRVSAAEERRDTGRAAELAGFSLVDPAGGCSHYYRGQPGLLDGFLVTKGQSAASQVAGACAELGCSKLPTAGLALAEVPEAFDEVSDHCPLVLSLGAP